MNFVSDNVYGAAQEILAALTAANTGTAASYGDDDVTVRLQEKFSTVFERAVTVFPVVSGTAANALALAAVAPSYGAIFCHADSHIAVDECGAAEFFSGGAKLVTLVGEGAKLTPSAIAEALKRFQSPPHSPKPCAISITQANEFGRVYKPVEIAALGDLAKREGLKLHMDGARFANALAHLGCRAADITWRADVDVLSFGATKNGALGAEAVIFFDKNDARDFEYRRKKAGHLVSKMRFISAQLEAYLEKDRWLAWAARANALATRMAKGIEMIVGAELAYPVEANALFVHLPDASVARLRAAGAQFYDWRPSSGGRTMVRLVLSYATPEDAVARFLEIARG
jgi:threonine aldolase